MCAYIYIYNCRIYLNTQPRRSTAETSQKSWSSRPLQEHYKRDNSHNYTNTTGATFRICKRCSHHQSFMDSHGSKTWTCHPKHSTGGLEKSSAVHKTGHCRAKGKIKSKSYPADVTFREAEKRLMDRVHRWSCVTGKNAPIVAIAEPQNRDSCHVSCVANDNKKTLKPYGTKTTFPRDCNSNHISVKSGNKLDTLDISSCSMDPCTGGETEQLAFQKDPLLEDSFITCSYYDTSTISPSLETDNDFQANLFVDSFSNIFDDLFCENKE